MIPDDHIIASIERTGYPPWMQTFYDETEVYDNDREENSDDD